MYKKFLFLLPLLLMPSLAMADTTCYEATGFGNPNTNGQYTVGGTFNSSPYFLNSSGYYLFSHPAGTSYWALFTSLDGSNASSYYNNTVVPPVDPLTGWNVDSNTGNTSPAGELAVCIPPTPGTGTSTAATTTVFNPNQDFANGLFIFTAWFFGIYWMFSKKR